MKAPPASRLLALTAIVIALAAAVAITGGRAGVAERPLVVPGLVAGEVTTLSVQRAQEAKVVVRITADDAAVIEPVPGPADEAVVRDLLSALVTARADRVTTGAKERARAGLDAPRVRVALTRAPGQRTEIALGRAVPESSQVWVGIDDRAYLVPAWIGDALDRDLLSLRRRRPFAGLAAITGVEIHGGGVDLVLAGQPLRRRDEGAGVRVAAAARARLEAALAAIVLDVLATGDLGQPRLTIRILGGTAPAELNLHGPCPAAPTHVLVDGTGGVGCVPAAAADELAAAARVLAGPDGVLTAPLEGAVESIVATTPASAGRGASGGASSTAGAPGGAANPSAAGAASNAGAPATATSGDVSFQLARRGAGWSLTLGAETTDADDDAVAAFFAALARPGTLAPAPPAARAADATWIVTLDGGATETWRWWWRGTPDGGALFHRDAEPHALALDPAASAAAHTFGARLRDRTVLAIEPTAVAAITAAGAVPATLQRGALVGEWIVTRPPGATATPAAAALVEALAHVRGAAWLADRDLGKIRRTITLTLDAPPVAGATPTVHTILVGTARPDGSCAARVDAFPPILLEAPLCAALLAPLAR